MATPASQQRKVIKLLQENNKLLKQLVRKKDDKPKAPKPNEEASK